jgi:hypothetical protein
MPALDRPLEKALEAIKLTIGRREKSPVPAQHALLDAFQLQCLEQLQVSPATWLWALSIDTVSPPPIPLPALQVQDLLASLLLSECVYKVVDYGAAAALEALTQFRDQFPHGAVPLTQAQFSRRRVDHRCAGVCGAIFQSSLVPKAERSRHRGMHCTAGTCWGGAPAPCSSRSRAQRS